MSNRSLPKLLIFAKSSPRKIYLVPLSSQSAVLEVSILARPAPVNSRGVKDLTWALLSKGRRLSRPVRNL